MSLPAGGADPFTQIRHALLESIERAEQESRAQADQIVREAEQRARQITVDATRQAGDLERQIAGLHQQMDQASAALAAVRTAAERLTQTLEASAAPAASPPEPFPPALSPLPPPAPEPRSESSEREAAFARLLDPPSGPEPPTEPSAPQAATDPSPPPSNVAPQPAAPPLESADSPEDTLRALRAALEALNQPLDPNGQKSP